VLPTEPFCLNCAIVQRAKKHGDVAQRIYQGDPLLQAAQHRTVQTGVPIQVRRGYSIASSQRILRSGLVVWRAGLRKRGGIVRSRSAAKSNGTASPTTARRSRRAGTNPGCGGDCSRQDCGPRLTAEVLPQTAEDRFWASIASVPPPDEAPLWPSELTRAGWVRHFLQHEEAEEVEFKAK